MPTSAEAEETPQVTLSPEEYRTAVGTLLQLGIISSYGDEWPCPQCFRQLSPTIPAEHDAGRCIFVCSTCGKWANDKAAEMWSAPEGHGWLETPTWVRPSNPKPLLGKVFHG